MRCCSALLLLVLACAAPAHAIDIDASKTTVPKQFVDPTGAKVTIFPSLSDPKRIDKANAIDFKQLETTLKVEPATISKQSAGENASVRVSLSVHNKGKRTVNLLFPTAQRYELVVRNSGGEAVYTWSADKLFEQSTGASMINNDDRITYVESIPVDKLSPGSYTVEATVFGYIALQAKATFEVTP